MINAYKYVMDDTLGGATITVTPQPVGIAACGMVTVAAPSVSYGCTCMVSRTEHRRSSLN